MFDFSKLTRTGIKNKHFLGLQIRLDQKTKLHSLINIKFEFTIDLGHSKDVLLPLHG
jgi:hypothetical protein